ncbi:MAG TPA: hypothetical protein VFH95_03905 [Candidatus Kapabacteria bacterium]|nr:hypothetical protein [Candidatus Kapabacteria bacterium]
MDSIILPMMAFGTEGDLKMICLDTDIVVAADNWDTLFRKMKDATLLYLRSFSSEELQAGAYIRKAPFKYQVRWKLGMTLSRIIRFISGPTEAIYDPQSSNLRFA